MRYLCLLPVLGLFLAPYPVSAATRLATPSTLRSHLSQMQPGDTLLLASGTYRERLDNLLPSGLSAQQPTVLQAAPGAQVTIRPPNQGYDTCGLCLRDRADITIRDLTFDLADIENCGLSVTGQSRDITITNNTFVHLHDARHRPNGGGGICGGTRATRLTVTHNTFRASRVTSYLVHPIYLAGSQNLIAYNHVSDNPGYGIQVYSDSPTRHQDTRGNVIRHNILERNARGIYAMGHGTQVSHNCFRGNEQLDLRWNRNGQVLDVPPGQGGNACASGPAPAPVSPPPPPVTRPVVPAPTALPPGGG